MLAEIEVTARERNVRFVGYDRRARRWHPKVARAAQERVQQILVDAGIDVPDDYFAEFDVLSSGSPVLIEKSNSRGIYRVISFAARDWSCVESSVADAVRQLASALAASSRNDSVARAFQSAGLTLAAATIKREKIADDDREHASVFIKKDISAEQFFAIVDHLEVELKLAGAGEVTGTGCGTGGWSIDLSAPCIEECIAVATEELNARKLDFDIQR